jgi:hypothetical protein
VRTTATQLLANPTVAAAGGFLFDTTFLWDGTTTTFPVQKIIDYAGTESLQLDTINATAGTANLHLQFNDDINAGPTVPILANHWYHASALFDAQGNAVAGDGSLAGMATLTATDLTDALPAVQSSSAMTKTTAGDDLDRAIGIGSLPLGNALVDLNGKIYDPSVALVPEPTGLASLLIGGLLVSRRRRRA